MKLPRPITVYVNEVAYATVDTLQDLLAVLRQARAEIGADCRVVDRSLEGEIELFF